MRSFRAGAALRLACVLHGCGGELTEQRDTKIAQSSSTLTSPATDRAPAPPAAATRAEPLPLLPGDITAPLDPLLADKWVRRDSAYDGWQTEVFNERAGPQLSKLGKLFAHPEKFDEQHLAALIDASYASGELRPSASSEAFRDGSTRVVRGAVSTELSFKGVNGAAKALRALAAPYAGAANAVAKFKVVSIEPEEAGVTTTVYFQSKGRPQSGATQQNATWRVRWTPLPGDSADAAPKITGIEVTEFSEVIAAGGGEPLFADCTAAVLGANSSFREQLTPSLEHWAATLDVQLGMSLIGHEGLALADVDGDDLDDIYLCQPGGLPNLLFLRQPDGTLRDVSREAGVDFLDPSRSALFADFDNDGDRDLAVELDRSIVLLANDGRGRFKLAFEAHAPSTTSMSAADFDGDGDLDLYCAGYILPDRVNTTPLPYHDANNGRPNTLLRNEGTASAWKFVDATREVGLDQNNRRFSFACAWEDYDDDGDQDLYVANDFGRNNLYRNDGGRFRDVAAEAGVEDLAAGMGVTWADYDLDGRIDLYTSNMFSSAGERITYQRQFMPDATAVTRAGFQRHARGNTLFKNMGDGTFADVSQRAGVSMGRWAWGALFTDFNNDGLPDIFCPNGYVTGEDPEDL